MLRSFQSAEYRVQLWNNYLLSDIPRLLPRPRCAGTGKEGVDDECQRVRRGSCIFIFYGDWRRSAQLPPPADAGYSFFHKEGDGASRRGFVVGYADTSTALCTLHTEL